MATVLEDILADLTTTLAGVTVANGYANTLTTARRFDIDNSRADVDPPYAEVSLFRNDMVEERINGIVSWACEIEVGVWALHNKSANPESTDAYIASLMTDCARAILADRKRNSNAKNTILGVTEKVDIVEGYPFQGFIMPVFVNYRTADADFTQAY